jgi:hypothetical protein
MCGRADGVLHHAGLRSINTISNARETRLGGEAAYWLDPLVTSDWHMRRAAWEMRRVLPQQVTIVEDAAHPSLVQHAAGRIQQISGHPPARPGHRAMSGAGKRALTPGEVVRSVLFGAMFYSVTVLMALVIPFLLLLPDRAAVVALCNGWSHMQRWGGTYSGREGAGGRHGAAGRGAGGDEA